MQQPKTTKSVHSCLPAAAAPSWRAPTSPSSPRGRNHRISAKWSIRSTRVPSIIVAALFGTAFGGGLEVALACHYRIALPSAKIGLPEVKIGLVPGAQGTQRLARLAGVDFALKHIVSGNPASAADALAAGAVDRVEDGDIVAAAVAYAEELVADGAPLRRASELTIDAGQYNDEYFAGFRKSIARKARGLNAPERCIQAIEAAVNLPFAEGVKRERELIMEAFADPQSKALQHVFFAEREAAKVPGLPEDVELKTVEVGRRNRRGHDGRWHLDELRQCRHSCHDPRNE